MRRYKRKISTSERLLRAPSFISGIVGAALLVASCAPERPDYINRTTHKEGSPTVIIVGKQNTTRDDIEKEIQSMPIWLQTRFDSTEGTAIFAESLITRGVLFREARTLGIENDLTVMKRYESNLLDWWLRAQTLLPPPTDSERRQYLASAAGKERFDTRDVYVIYVASKAMADDVAKRAAAADENSRLGVFKSLVAEYTMDPTTRATDGYVASISRHSYDEERKPPTSTLLSNPPIKVEDKLRAVNGVIGPLDLDTPAWTVVGPTRDAVLWKVYLLGPWKSAADAVGASEDPVPNGDRAEKGDASVTDGSDPSSASNDVNITGVDEQILLERRRALVKKIAGNTMEAGSSN